MVGSSTSPKQSFAKKIKTPTEDTINTKPSSYDAQLTSDPKCSNMMEEKVEKVKKRRCGMPPYQIRFDRIDHLPEIRASKSRNRCRREACTLKTNNFCVKCKVYLCNKEGRSCFKDFHTLQC